jgi:hypothetical protein
MAQGRRKKGRPFIGIGGDSRLASKSSVLEVRGYDGMAGASPAEQRRPRGRKRPPARSIENIAGYSSFSDEKFEQMREKQRKSDLKRIREIRRRQRAQAQLEKGKQGKTGRGVAGRAASVGMGPSQVTTGGGLGMLTQQDRSKPKKMNMGGVMKSRGGTFKGVF